MWVHELNWSRCILDIDDTHYPLLESYVLHAEAWNYQKICWWHSMVAFPLLIPYSLLVIPAWSHIVFTFFIQIPSPDLLVEFFADEQAITLTWLHVLICNLFVGRYVWLRMLAADQPMYVSTPILLMCMYSPVGLLLGLLTTWEQRDLGGTNFEVQPVSSAEV